MEKGFTIEVYNNTNTEKEIQLYLELESKIYPEYPCNNLAECFYRLKQSLNLPEYHQHSIGIKFKNYVDNKKIFAQLLKKSRC